MAHEAQWAAATIRVGRSIMRSVVTEIWRFQTSLRLRLYNKLKWTPQKVNCHVNSLDLWVQKI